MAKQLVLKGNKVVAYGEDCFLCVGNDVHRTTDNKVYEGATVAEYTATLPDDIDDFEYEYHAGVFIPCGTVPVGWVGKTYHTTYTGTGSSTCGVTCGFRPKRIIITGWKEWTSSAEGFWVCVIDTDTVWGYGYGLTIDKNGNASGMVKCTATDTGATWTATATTTTSNAAAMNASSSGQTYNYSITVFG